VQKLKGGHPKAKVPIANKEEMAERHGKTIRSTGDRFSM
jgi:hypothetical protein